MKGALGSPNRGQRASDATTADRRATLRAKPWFSPPAVKAGGGGVMKSTGGALGAAVCSLAEQNHRGSLAFDRISNMRK